MIRILLFSKIIRDADKIDIIRDADKIDIIRDADKIDIIRAYTHYNDYDLKSDNNEISRDVKSEFYSNKQITKKLKLEDNDKIIFLIAMIFDINFKESLELVKKDKIIEKLYEKIDNKGIFKPYFDYMEKYLEER